MVTLLPWRDIVVYLQQGMAVKMTEALGLFCILCIGDVFLLTAQSWVKRTEKTSASRLNTLPAATRSRPLEDKAGNFFVALWW